MSDKWQFLGTSLHSIDDADDKPDEEGEAQDADDTHQPVEMQRNAEYDTT